MSEITPQQVKRNVLRFMGFDLPDEILDKIDPKDIKVDGDKFKVKVALPINTKDWRGCYGSTQA